ncbi:trans-sialidase, partial [Trypanosoma cruzi]
MAAGMVMLCFAVSGGGVYCCCAAFLLLFSVAPYEEGSYYQTRIATLEFEGSERTNNRTHTYIYMLSRVAAVKAPRTHNRRRVTGSSGRRREGRESEPRRPNMSRRVFASAVLLLLVVLICCGTCGAAATEKPNSGKNDLINIQNLQRVDLFVPQTTLVLPKMGTDSGRRDSFVSPSLVSAGGVIA